MTRVRRFLKRKFYQDGIPHSYVSSTLEGTPLEAHYVSQFTDSFSSFFREQPSARVFHNPSGSVDFNGVLQLASLGERFATYQDLVWQLSQKHAFGQDAPANTLLAAPPAGQGRHEAFAPGPECLLVDAAVWSPGLLLEWAWLDGKPVHVRLECHRTMVPRPTLDDPEHKEPCARVYLRLLEVYRVSLRAKKSTIPPGVPPCTDSMQSTGAGAQGAAGAPQ